MLKIGHLAKAITHARGLCGMVSLNQDVIKSAKNMGKPILQEH